VVNAVVDALRPLGVHDVTMPCTPERVWRAINEGSAGGETTGAAAAHFDPSTGMSGNVDRTEGDVQ
jgi:carbon-monoxide dehydrogenase large subunit